MTITPRTLFVILGVTLSFVAWAAPAMERQTDRGAYEATASRFIVSDCSDLHCFRVLVPWTLGAIPGPSLAKWKAYAVVANLFAAVAVFALSIAWGLSMRASMMASLMSALGFGSLYTLFDPFTSDPLMYAIGPFLVWLLLKDRLAAAGLVAAIGVLAKEFAAAPMLIWSAATAATGRWSEALRVLSAANVALIAWLSLQLILIIGFNYSYADNASTHLLSGGYLWRWLSTQTWLVSAFAIFGEFGMLWVLAPAGLFLAPASMRTFALASIPVALLFAYVQQPDRALWNFHFLAAPLAALVLERAPAAVAGACIGIFALGNLRLGAQLSMVPPSRASLVLSTLLAILCLYRLPLPLPAASAAGGRDRVVMSNRRLGALVAFEMVVLLVLLTAAFDQYAHAQVEMVDGLNRWGYRGAVAKRRVYDETRIMMIGGSRAFEPGVPVSQTITERIRFRVQEWVTHDRGPVTAINLGVVNLPRGAYASRLEQYRYLEPDVICIYTEFSPAMTPPSPSLAMRITGYLPAAGALAAIDRALGSMFAIATTDDIGDVADAVVVSLTMAPTVVILPRTGSEDDERSRTALLASFDRFAGDKRLKLVQLAHEVAIGDQIEPAVSEFLRLRTAPAAAR